jgi:hypothetical protein
MRMNEECGRRHALWCSRPGATASDSDGRIWGLLRVETALRKILGPGA